MSIEKELDRRRFQVSAEGIARRHRQAQLDAERLMRTSTQPTPSDGVDPSFRSQIEAAQQKTKAALDAPLIRGDLDHVLGKLREQGKLPPVEKPDNVGYEPTPEEILGDLAALPAREPEELEDTPSADQVLSGQVLSGEAAEGDGTDFTPTDADDWGEPPAPAAAPFSSVPAPTSNAAGNPTDNTVPMPGLARSGPMRQHTAKRARK
jgi:hypothetical protein